MKQAEKKNTANLSPPTTQEQPPFFAGSGHDFFGSSPAESFFSPAFIQPKLTVNAPNDTYEQEADAMAEHVMRSLDQTAVKPTGLSVIPHHQTGSDEGALHKKEDEPTENEHPERSTLPVGMGSADSNNGDTHQPFTNRPVLLQRKSTTESRPSADPISNALATSKGSGTTLAPRLREEMEGAFNHNFSSVHVHTNRQASDMNRQIQAKAFTHQNDIYFNEGQFAPNTSEGKKLLAHELTHVVQQQAAPPGRLQRQQAQTTLTSEPSSSAIPVATMQVTLSGLRFTPQGNPTYEEATLEGRAFRLMKIIVRRLIGDQYNTELASRIYDAYAAKGGGFTGNFERAKPTDRMQEIVIDIDYSNILLDIIANQFHLPTVLTADQKELLALGQSSSSAFRQLQPNLPPWYTSFIFDREMAQQGDLIRAYHTSRMAGPINTQQQSDALDAILMAIAPAANVLDAIRLDFSLANLFLENATTEPEIRRRFDVSIVYRALWNLEVSHDKAVQITSAPSDSAVNPTAAVMFLAFIRTQKQLLEQAVYDDTQARRELLERFARFFKRVTTGGKGDEAIMNHPSQANADPWKSTLSSSPVLRPPTFDAALETDHRFSMNIEFGSVFDAFVSYSYLWERIKLPEPKTENDPPADLDKLAGERPSLGEVYDVRMRRAHRYNAADIARIQEETGLPFGTGAHDLVHMNNVLRLAGTVVRLGLERLTMPRSDKQIVFPEAGLYVIRCRAVPYINDNAEVIHAPSVAYQPVLARDPVEMASGYVKDTARTQFQARVRLAEIQNMLEAPFADQDREELLQEAAMLKEMLLEPGELLVSRKQKTQNEIDRVSRRIRIRAQIRTLEQLPASDEQTKQLADLNATLRELDGLTTTNYDDERLLRRLERQKDQLSETLQNRENRASEQGDGLRETLMATFVSDMGNSLELSLELYDHGVVDGKRKVFISDLTTPSSGVGRASVSHKSPESDAAKVEAVRQALRDCLETSSDYGRGQIAFRVNGQIYTQRIEAGTGRMFSEAIENATMVMSIAAILAAPFTAGESLVLLLPLGAIGALPAAYRIYTRVDSGTFRWLDLNTIMDVVNIVGGFIGLARAATPLRLVRMGQVLMVTGMGVDAAGMLLMGAGIAQQLAALQDLPEGERAAKMLEIMGMAFVQLGIQAGGMLAHARYGSNSSTSKPGASGSERPGFHIEPDGNAPPATRPTQAPVEHTTNGLGRPGGSEPPRPALSGEAPRPTEHGQPLLELLDRGIDRSQRPPSLPEGAPRQVPAGDYKRATRSPREAHSLYNEALNVAAGREVGVYFNTETGEYRIRIGTEGSVNGPYGHDWIAIVHYHPNPGNVATYRLPAPADFQSLIQRYFVEGNAVREFVEFDLPGLGRGRTEYGIDPNHAEPFYVKMTMADGTTRTLRFANDGSYHAYWGERTVYIEPGSPEYQRMIDDISAYLNTRENAGEPTQKPGSPTPENPQPGGKTTSGVTPANEPTSLQTGMGELTTQGVDFIRRRFKTVGKKPSRAVSSLTDAEIREQFHNQPNWLEAIVLAEARSEWLGRTSPTDFLIAQNNGMPFREIFTRLQKGVTNGKTGHVLQESVLHERTGDFVERLLAEHDPVLEPAYNACAQNQDPAFRRRWQEFQYKQGKGDMTGFLLGEVGSKRPDFVEVMLSQNEVHIYDATFAQGDPIHNFKSAFYKAVMERLINVGTVNSTDYRSPFRQTPIGP